MLKRFQLFMRGLSTNWAGTLGVVLTTSTFFLFVFKELLQAAGIVTNAYLGLISYLALPALFLFGLILIPLGWARFKRTTGKTTDQLLAERFPREMISQRGLGSNLIGMIALLTLVNLMFLGIGGARMLHFMDEPRFCGTACHQVMNPEWTAYQSSPHAHVRCVDCHVGEGAEALIDAKLNGLKQIISATFDLYERPIPTPVHNLRPARETCEKCHWPEKFYGERIRTLPTYAFDEASTPSFTTLALKVGSGAGREKGTIHWHVAPRNEVRYQPVDDSRLSMAWVEVRRGDSFHRYNNRHLASDRTEPEAVREQPLDAPQPESKHGLPPVHSLDCVDCHNRATHIYPEPEAALDQALAAGTISRDLPFAKKVALGALLGRYADKAAAMTGIANAIHGTYRREHPRAATAARRELDQMVATLQDIYRLGIHPEMNIGWNSYPSHLGHRGQAGCSRCHSPNLVDAQGKSIPYDCTLCHFILAYDSPDPFHYLGPVAEKDPDRKMHAYLQQEFLTGSR